MEASRSVSKEVARLLLEVEAVRLRPMEPFTWASGWKSPIYCDNRVSLSSPKVRSYIKEQLASLIKSKYSAVTALSGVATGAIAQGALVADLLELPFSYIRSAPKDHGMGNQIEGRISQSDQVVVVEDLVSTGGSSLRAVEALRREGYEVLGMVAIYTHGLPIASELFKKSDVVLYTLSDYDTVIATAIEMGYISAEEQALLAAWREAPETWGR